MHVDWRVAEKRSPMVAFDTGPTHQRACGVAQTLKNDIALWAEERLDSTIEALADCAGPHTRTRGGEMLEKRAWPLRELDKTLA